MKKMHINKKVLIITVSIILAILVIGIILFKTGTIDKIINIFKKEELVEFEYDIYSVSGNIGTVKVIFRNENGIDKIEYPEKAGEEKFEIYPEGQTQVAIDYEMEDFKEYKFKLTDTKGTEKEYIVNFEIPRINGVYTFKNGIYVNEPDISTGFVKEKTRYLYLNDDGNLVPGNWVTDTAPDNWYDYKEQKWANIYVENNGVESYYVWVPRYCYKVDTDNTVTGNERMDVKFINTYNEYVDGITGNKTTWDELQEKGYQIPEAFKWENKNGADLIIPGYWLSKYQLSELESYTIDYNLTASTDSFNVSNFTNNVSADATQYTYAINGKIVNTSTTLDDYSFDNTTPDKTNYINITALNDKGQIVGSMTKELELATANEPDLTGFDENTTFYVYWDEKGNEHNEIPISMEPPEDWYNYTYSRWANIVTRNNGQEAYLVWIPRYQYRLDQTSQRSSVKFINGTSSETTAGYAIPEAFTFLKDDGTQTQLTGYWLSKYQLSIEEQKTNLDVEIATTEDSIRINNVTGKIVEDAKANSKNLVCQYYINGRYLENETNTYGESGTNEGFSFKIADVQQGNEYVINIILRDKDTDEYVGAVTKKVLITKPNKPELTGFEESKTYYVIYEKDANGNIIDEKIGDNIKNDGSNIPKYWYNYQDREWANIVVTDGQVVDGKIQNAKSIAYFTWIPRYEYRILGNRENESKDNKRTEINYIAGDKNETSNGYKIPEAFTFIKDDGTETQLTGYWLSKYQLSE